MKILACSLTIVATVLLAAGFAAEVPPAAAPVPPLQTMRTDGVTEADALYSIRTDDGTVIIVRNQGVIAAGGAYMRTAVRFSAPAGPHAWLNESQFVSAIAGGPRPGTVVNRVFRVH